MKLHEKEEQAIKEFRRIIEILHDPRNFNKFPQLGQELARLCWLNIPLMTMEVFEQEWKRLRS